MRLSLLMKLLLYRFFSARFGKKILNALSFWVKAKNLGASKKEKKHPFLIAITVDTESGYVDKNERRIWQREKPDAFEGYYFGIKNLFAVFDKYKVKSTFFLSTQCFSAENREYRLIKGQLDSLLKNKHELGLHLHPDSDFALQKKMMRKFNATSAFFYDYKEKYGIIKAAREIIKNNLGRNAEKNLISFRWGNWALDSGGARALDSLGFKIDSSATPGIKGHLNDTMKYDWSKVRTHYPWKLSINDYQSVKDSNSSIIEMPIATFTFFGIKLRADPVNSVLLNRAFIEYYRKADRSEKPFVFVVITHSPEATYKDGKITRTLKDLEDFIISAKKFEDVMFVSLREAYKESFA